MNFLFLCTFQIIITIINYFRSNYWLLYLIKIMCLILFYFIVLLISSSFFHIISQLMNYLSFWYDFRVINTVTSLHFLFLCLFINVIFLYQSGLFSSNLLFTMFILLLDYWLNYLKFSTNILVIIIFFFYYILNVFCFMIMLSFL